MEYIGIEDLNDEPIHVGDELKVVGKWMPKNLCGVVVELDGIYQLKCENINIKMFSSFSDHVKPEDKVHGKCFLKVK